VLQDARYIPRAPTPPAKHENQMTKLALHKRTGRDGDLSLFHILVEQVTERKLRLLPLRPW